MLLAMFALVLFTFSIMLLMAVMRFRSVGRREVPGAYYRLMSGYQVPDYIVKSGRQFSNLFETPVLFYTAGILYVTLDIQSVIAVVAAWSYVALRIVHAAIHLTYNHPVHRFFVFALSILCILILWVVLVLHV